MLVYVAWRGLNKLGGGGGGMIVCCPDGVMILFGE